MARHSQPGEDKGTPLWADCGYVGVSLIREVESLFSRRVSLISVVGNFRKKSLEHMGFSQPGGVPRG